MKVSYNWLKEYLDLSGTPLELASQLTRVGFEVEEWHALVPEFSGVKVARVETVNKHPQADKLSVCEVFDGTTRFQVICGAPNVAAGQLVPFAAPGAVLPGGQEIKRVKIRGVESFGMICSRQELGLEKQSEGIWPLDNRLSPGSNVYDVLAVDQDYIFDINVAPNRPDCLSIIGMAREIAAIRAQQLRLPAIELREEMSDPVQSYIKIKIADTEGCRRYAGRVIRGVTVAPSPEWLQKRLESAGMRPINNLVDITNFVLMETGHPLHAFDLQQLQGGSIQVRTAQPGEKFVTLDQKERLLPENTVMICDDGRTVAIGGIMGGLNSEVTEQTIDVLLESAYFDPQHIAYSSRKLGLNSEASQRFERGADINNVIFAINRAAALMAEIAGGKVCSGVVDVYPEPAAPVMIPFRPERINKLLGSNITASQMRLILERLQLQVRETDIVIPAFRVDLTKEIDLVEEVARHTNYSNLPTRITTEILYENPESILEKQIVQLRENLVGLGLQEVITSSMLARDEARSFSAQPAVEIMNPISDDMSVMRPSLLPGLLKTAAYNLNRNNKNLRLFEIGRIFSSAMTDGLPQQPYSVAFLICGSRTPVTWNNAHTSVDFYDIKGLLEAFLEKIRLDNSQLILYDKAEFMSPGEAAEIRYNNDMIGLCGKVSEKVCAAFGIETDIYAVELDIPRITALWNMQPVYKPIARFPYSERDMAFIFDDSVSAAEIMEYIRQTGGNLLNFIEIFDLFKGGNIPPDKKSLAIRLRFQSVDRTLSDMEVDEIFTGMISRIEQRFQASLRK
jgi:phenylalanyl-tRNA synthetase beta chain